MPIFAVCTGTIQTYHLYGFKAFVTDYQGLEYSLVIGMLLIMFVCLHLRIDVVFFYFFVYAITMEFADVNTPNLIHAILHFTWSFPFGIIVFYRCFEHRAKRYQFYFYLWVSVILYQFIQFFLFYSIDVEYLYPFYRIIQFGKFFYQKIRHEALVKKSS